jgi:hypothetical protein
MTPCGIEPVTFRFVAQYLNHCATAAPPPLYSYYWNNFNRHYTILILWSDCQTVSNCVLVIRTSPGRWQEYRPKHFGENVVDKYVINVEVHLLFIYVFVDLVNARKMERIKIEFVFLHISLRVSIRIVIRFQKLQAWYEISLNIYCTLRYDINCRNLHNIKITS